MIENPTKIFPCVCLGEGLVITKEENIDSLNKDAPFLTISSWQFWQNNDKRSWRWRLKTCLRILRNGCNKSDVVTFKAKIAKNFAYHIIYLLNKDKEKKGDYND